MKKLLALLMAMTLIFTFFVVAEAEETVYTYSSDWNIEIGSKNGGMWAVSTAFDGKNETYWHSWYRAEGASVVESDKCPHTMTVTFPEAIEITAVSYTPRQDSNASGTWKKAEIYGSADGTDFTKLCDATYDVANSRAETKTVIPKNNYKAIRLVTTESVSGYSTIGEIRFYSGGEGASVFEALPDDSALNANKEVHKMSADGEIVLNAAEADSFSGVKKNESGTVNWLAGNYIAFANVDFTGVKSVKILGDSLIPSIENGDAYQIRIDDPNKGDCLGYVLFNKKEALDTVFSVNITETTGVHNLYIKSTYGQLSDNVLKTITLSAEAVPGGNREAVPDSAIVDNFADTWAGTDALGRKLADYEEVGPVKDGLHEVAMFYWNWTTNNTSNARIPAEIIAAHPEAKDDYYHEAWDTNGRYLWGEPLFGYYTSYDYFTYRRHAEMLANAGVDAIFLDMSNDSWAFVPTTILLFEAFADAKEAGVNIPEIFTWSTNTHMGFRSLYHNIIENPRFRDIWYEWDGKKLVFGGNPQGAYDTYGKGEDVETNRVLKDIVDNFTWRRNAERNAKDEGIAIGWQWLQNYPQTKWKTSATAERTECMAIGTGINHSYVFGYEKTGVFSDPYTKGRSYTEAFGEDYRPDAKNQGYFFREQASRVLEEDPMIIMVDGWNEWAAARNAVYSGFTNAFVDTFDEENSRDFEPSRGALRDDYYNLFVDFVRKYKGVRPAPLATAETVIDLEGDDSQWTNVGPEFLNVVEGYEREHEGLINPETGENFRYTTKISNLIKSAKVARSSDKLYFTALCENDIVKNDSFMHLYIDVDRNRATGWEGYDYSYNVLATGAFAKYENGAWVEVTGSEEAISGKRITVALPREVLGETGLVDLEFKWADNVFENGDLLLFYEHGSVAPNGRFNYLYTEIEQKSLDKNTRDNLYDTTVIKENHNRMNVNGGEMYVYEADTRVTTITENGTLYIPVTAAEEILGYGETKYEFYPDKNMLHLSTHGLENFEITDYVWSYTVLGTNEVRINGRAAALTNPAKVINGICCIPVSYFSEVFGWNVTNADGIWTISRNQADTSAVAKAAELL